MLHDVTYKDFIFLSPLKLRVAFKKSLVSELKLDSTPKIFLKHISILELRNFLSLYAYRPYKPQKYANIKDIRNQ